MISESLGSNLLILLNSLLLSTSFPTQVTAAASSCAGFTETSIDPSQLPSFRRIHLIRGCEKGYNGSALTRPDRVNWRIHAVANDSQPLSIWMTPPDLVIPYVEQDNEHVPNGLLQFWYNRAANWTIESGDPGVEIILPISRIDEISFGFTGEIASLVLEGDMNVTNRAQHTTINIQSTGHVQYVMMGDKTLTEIQAPTVSLKVDASLSASVDVKGAITSGSVNGTSALVFVDGEVEKLDIDAGNATHGNQVVVSSKSSSGCSNVVVTDADAPQDTCRVEDITILAVTPAPCTSSNSKIMTCDCSRDVKSCSVEPDDDTSTSGAYLGGAGTALEGASLALLAVVALL